MISTSLVAEVSAETEGEERRRAERRVRADKAPVV